MSKKGHGHHGGAWKVAYADFVTAMMAFFMVMWILGMNDASRKAIEGYFSNPAGFTEFGGWVFSTLAWQLGRFTNSFQVELEGHTEKSDIPDTGSYGPWELTSERANAARRKLVENGMPTKLIRKVAGFGDTIPLLNKKPTDEANRRVAVLLKVPSGKL